MLNIELEDTDSIKKPKVRRNIEFLVSKGNQCKKRKFCEEQEEDVKEHFVTSINSHIQVPDHEPQNKKQDSKKWNYMKYSNKEGEEKEQEKGQLLETVPLLEQANLKLKRQRKKNKLLAKLTKNDLQTKKISPNIELKAKRQAHSLELNLAKADITKVQIPEQKACIEVGSSTEKKFNRTRFCNIPDDLQRKVNGYLTDDELFAARVLNKIFYGSYYGQRVRLGESWKFNFERALKLAKIGRIFRNLVYFELKFCDESCVEYLNGLHFPSLTYLDIYSNEDSIPRNVNIKNVRYAYMPCRGSFSQDKFPNTEELIWAVDDRYEGPCYLPELRIITFEFFQYLWWSFISKNKYPSLKLVTFDPEVINSDSDDYDEYEHNFFDHDCNRGIVKMRSQGVTVSGL